MKKIFIGIRILFGVLLIIISLGALISGDIIIGIVIAGVGLILVFHKRKNKTASMPLSTQSSRSFFSKVVGVTFLNNDGTDPQKILKNCKIGEKLQLICEPIPEDKNAVKVCRASGEQIGWLKRRLSKEITQFLSNSGKIEVEISDLTGGKSGESRGCNIKITKYSA